MTILLRAARTLLPAAWILVGSAAAQAAPMIAVVQNEAIPNTDGKTRDGLRLAFVNTADGWTAICDASKDKNNGCKFDAGRSSQWFVTSGGKQIAQIKAQGWLDNDYSSETGLLKIRGAVPRAGKRDHLFGGWPDAKVYPALIATSVQPGTSNRWRSVYPEKMTMAAILPVLKKHVPVIPDCRGGGQNDSRPGRAPTASDVHVFGTWTTKNGEILVQAGLKPELVKGCDFTADALADVWLYDDGNAGPRGLPALIADEATHQLIAIGDFAGDGPEEALFFLSGYNEDGFVLYYDHFQKAATFIWGYQ